MHENARHAPRTNYKNAADAEKLLGTLIWKHSVTYTSVAQSVVFCNMLILFVLKKKIEISEADEEWKSYQIEFNKHSKKLKSNEINQHTAELLIPNFSLFSSPP